MKKAINMKPVESTQLEFSEISADAVDRLISTSITLGERRCRARLFAMAASVFAFVGATIFAVHLSLPGPGVGDAPAVFLASGAGHPVRLTYDSQVDRSDARVSVNLGPRLELAGRPGVRQVTFDAPLKRGKNLLELPLNLIDAAESRLEVAFSSGEGVKRIQIVIRAADAMLDEAKINSADKARSVS